MRDASSARRSLGRRPWRRQGGPPGDPALAQLARRAAARPRSSTRRSTASPTRSAGSATGSPISPATGPTSARAVEQRHVVLRVLSAARRSVAPGHRGQATTRWTDRSCSRQGRPRLGRPTGDESSKVIIDLKTGRSSPRHRDDLRFYALVETLARELPPRLWPPTRSIRARRTSRPSPKRAALGAAPHARRHRADDRADRARAARRKPPPSATASAAAELDGGRADSAGRHQRRRARRAGRPRATVAMAARLHGGLRLADQVGAERAAAASRSSTTITSPHSDAGPSGSPARSTTSTISPPADAVEALADLAGLAHPLQRRTGGVGDGPARALELVGGDHDVVERIAPSGWSANIGVAGVDGPRSARRRCP